jgi:hypothetical protein
MENLTRSNRQPARPQTNPRNSGLTHFLTGLLILTTLVTTLAFGLKNTVLTAQFSTTTLTSTKNIPLAQQAIKEQATAQVASLSQVASIADDLISTDNTKIALSWLIQAVYTGQAETIQTDAIDTQIKSSLKNNTSELEYALYSAILEVALPSINSYLTQQVTTDVQAIHTQVATANRYTQLAFTIGWISSLLLIVLLIFSTRSIRKFFRSLGWTGFLTALFGVASLLIGKAVVLSQLPATNIPDELISNYLTSTVMAILPLFVASLIIGIVLSLLSLIGKRR